MSTRTRSVWEAGRADHIPEATSGAWEVRRIEVLPADEEFGKLRALINSHGRYVPAGIYTQLLCRGSVVMSDTPDELNDHAALLWHGGRVLVNGLGLGCGVRLALNAERHLRKPVEHIDIVEISEDVLNLVGPSLADDPRVTLHHADAFTKQWPAGTRWDFAWHDVWDSISADNLRGEGSYEALHRKYGRRCGAQASWAFDLAKRWRDR